MENDPESLAIFPDVCKDLNKPIFFQRYSATSNFSADSIAVHLSNTGHKQLFTKTGYYKVTNGYHCYRNFPILQLK